MPTLRLPTTLVRVTESRRIDVGRSFRNENREAHVQGRAIRIN